MSISMSRPRTTFSGTTASSSARWTFSAEAKEHHDTQAASMKLSMRPLKSLPILSLLLLAATSAQADTVVVTADRTVDVIAGRVVEHPQITIVDGRISAVA